MNSQYNNQFNSNLKSASGKLLLPSLSFLLVLFSVFVGDHIINYFIPDQHKQVSVDTQNKTDQPSQIATTDEQFDKMLERNHRIHDIVEKHISETFVLFGSIGIVLIFAGRYWVGKEVEEHIKSEKNKVEEISWERIINTSELMILFSWINDEELISHVPFLTPSKAKILKDSIENKLKGIEGKMPDINLTPVFNVKLGDLYSYIGNYYYEEAEYKKNYDLKKMAKDMYEKGIKKYKFATEKKSDKNDVMVMESIFWCQTYCKLGNLNTDIENYDEADSSYIEALKIMPSYYWSYHSHGDLFVKKAKDQKDKEARNEEYREAIKKYEEALKIQPTNAVTLYKKGIVYATLNQDIKAIECYEKALQFSDKNSWILHSWGDSINKLWRYDNQEYDEKTEKDIIDKYQKSIDSNYTRYKSLIEWGNVLLKSAYFLDRLAYFRESKYSDNAFMKRKEAIEKYKKALDMADFMKDNTCDIWYARGNAELYSSEYIAANECYKKAMKEKDKSPQWKDDFDNNFRNWAKQSYVIIHVIETLLHNSIISTNYDTKIKEYQDLNQKMLKEATEIFDNTFGKTLDRTKTDMTDEEEKEKVNALYNQAMFYCFKFELENAQEQLNIAKEINSDYLNELRDKDLDWGLFFKKLD
ncbi:MAG: tetratricopeptide repeat protein [Nostoc sp. TH1S01]|nr:tetratricopeptide repeat protein [Nostoc sp. TH1S01]